MMPDSTARLMQILRTTLALIKYYEGHPASSAITSELKLNLQHAIDDLVAVESAERTPEVDGAPEFLSLSDMDIRELDPERNR
jgi:hypothetical protein